MTMDESKQVCEEQIDEEEEEGSGRRFLLPSHPSKHDKLKKNNYFL